MWGHGEETGSRVVDRSTSASNQVSLIRESDHRPSSATSWVSNSLSEFSSAKDISKMHHEPLLALIRCVKIWSWSKLGKGAQKSMQFGSPWWLSGKEFACQCRRHRSYLWSRRSPHTMEQLSPCTATVQPVLSSLGTATTETMCLSYWSPHAQEPVLCNERSCHNEKPMPCN